QTATGVRRSRRAPPLTAPRASPFPARHDIRAELQQAENPITALQSAAARRGPRRKLSDLPVTLLLRASQGRQRWLISAHATPPPPPSAPGGAARRRALPPAGPPGPLTPRPRAGGPPCRTPGGGPHQTIPRVRAVGRDTHAGPVGGTHPPQGGAPPPDWGPAP